MLRVESVGASFAGFTVIVNVCVTILLEDWLSLTVTVTTAEPLALAAGVKLKLPFEFGLV